MPDARVDLDVLLAATSDLTLAGRYDSARALLGSVSVPDPAARLRLMTTEAEVVQRFDYAQGVPTRSHAQLDAADMLADDLDADDCTRWDLAMVRLRGRYADRLMGSSDAESSDDELAAEADRLHSSAPDDRRRGWAAMCRGWIADNLRGDRPAAPAAYAEALVVGRTTDEPMLIFEAQRHLGDHAHDDGRHDEALAAWQESAAAAARAGYVSGVLAQQLLLAVLARDVGDEAGAVLLAAEVQRWSAAVGAVGREQQAAAFLAGADPTRPPENGP